MKKVNKKCKTVKTKCEKYKNSEQIENKKWNNYETNTKKYNKMKKSEKSEKVKKVKKLKKKKS